MSARGARHGFRNENDGSRGEVFLDPLRGSGMGCFQRVGLELLSMLAIDDPSPQRLEVLAGRDGSCDSDQRD